MADLQAEIELSVELRKFCNIDLFAQGYYQVRVGVKCNPKIQSATKVEIKSECPLPFDDPNEQIYPACIFNDWGISKTFLVIYKNEEVQLDDQINFKLSVIVDAQNITEYFNRIDMQLMVELYFLEKEYSSEKLSTMQQLCSRCYKLHFNPRLGIHTRTPIIFDYFHLSAVTATVHASLLCLIPPYVFDRPNVRRTSLFSFLFGQDLSQITTDQVNPNLLDRAYQLHNTICEILLSSYESLQDCYEKMIEQLSTNKEKSAHVHQNCRPKLKTLCDKLKTLEDIHTIDNLAHAHIAQCSAENIMLWCQFMQVFSFHDDAAVTLAKEYHLKRVKRLSEGFFLRETSRINFLTNESDQYNDFHDLVRNSPYYSRLPHLPIECAEVDGLPDTLPILIEEIYSAVEDQPNSSLVLTRTLSKNENTIQDASKGTISSSANLESKTEKTMVTVVPGTGSLPSPTLVTQDPSLSRNASRSTNMASKFQRSNRSVLSFRSPTPKNSNPIAALSNDSSVRLTSFRKFDEDNSETSLSTSYNITLKSAVEPNSGSTLGLFSYPSDSNINKSTRKRSHSLRLSKKLSSHSLPDVPTQRRKCSSEVKAVVDSSTIPKFFSSPSDRTEDEVFPSTAQDAESTFDDSSMKSKVLQASFRGKVGTMERRTASTSSRSLSNSLPFNSSHEKAITGETSQAFSMKSNASDNRKFDDQTENMFDSVLQLTLQLEKNATTNIQQRHPISTDDINPLLLNGLTDDENQLNFIENANGQSLSMLMDYEQSGETLEPKVDKEKTSPETDRIQHNSTINSQTIEYVMHKEKLKQTLQLKYSSNLMFYSDLSNPFSTNPYFYQEFAPFNTNRVHLIICVHGLDGNSSDLRLIKTYLELCLLSSRLEFLMSSANHSSTFDDIDIMVKQLIDEIDTHIERYSLKPERISFVGHSLGNLIIRAAVSHSRFERYRPVLYTYLSLSGPHLGTLFNTSGLVNMGMWLMQKWKKSCSLSQMSFKDHIDPKKTYLYNLSKKPSLEFFKNILLIASPQDRYVPFHSARIEVCKAALKDTAYGSVYVEMINNLLGPILRNPSITFIRYNALHSIPSGTNNIIGRAAHIAILDSEFFVEKLILVSAAKYFK